MARSFSLTMLPHMIYSVKPRYASDNNRLSLSRFFLFLSLVEQKNEKVRRCEENNFT